MTRRIILLLLALAPREFRERYRHELLDVYEHRRATGLGGFVFDAREVIGVAAAVAGLWLARSRARRAAGARGSRRSLGRMASVWQDVRFAFRTLRRSPGFAFVAITVLALGIGATTAIFSAVNAFFFRPLPFGDPERLVVVYETNPEFGWVDQTAAPANLLDWREQVDAFDDVTGYADFEARVTTYRDGEPVVLNAAQVVGNFFSTLGARPALGRTFDVGETWAGASDVTVISHDLWVTQFGADAAVVGRRLELANDTLEIIGVMPEGFAFPRERTQLWLTFGWAPEAREEVGFRRAHYVRGLARVAPGYDLHQADAALQVVATRLQGEYPETNSVMGAGITPLRAFLVRDVRAPLIVLLGAVALLLLLACANIANLMLVRVGQRTRELALRHALGAGKARVVRQLLTESLVIGLLGGGVGLAFGWWGVLGMSALTPVGIDGATSLALDHRVVLFALSTALLSAMLFGAAPALRALGRDIHTAVKEGSRGATGGRTSLRSTRFLVATELALAVLLVVGAGLTVRSVWLLRHVDPGFRTSGVAAAQISVPAARYSSRDEVLDFYDRLAAALEATPAVERAGSVGRLPLTGENWTSQFRAERWPPDRVGFEIVHRRADAGFFEAMGTPVLRGRGFDASDEADGPRVAMINATFAEQHFTGEDPVGQRISFNRVTGPESIWWEIVGVVADQHQVAPGIPPRAEVFEHRDQDWGRSNWVVVRGGDGETDLVTVVRSVLAELDPLIPIAESRTLDDVWHASMARDNVLLSLLGAFGVLALLLATVGVYGVTAQAARRRTQEIGIRMALGAGAPDVLGMILRQGLVVIGLGLFVGLGISLLATRALATLLFGVSPTDPATLASVVALLGTVGLAACYLPARRATSVDLVRSLRTE